MSTLPTVVAMGGGHGLSSTLHALRLLAVRPVAVVSVADDGGSTGRLRAASNRVAPGDLRKSLVSLAEHEGPLSEVMEHRFASGDLQGHSFGNLMFAAFEETTGSVLGALEAMSELLGVRGEVLPATLEPVDLVAELGDSSVVVGEELISSSGGIRQISLYPTPRACERALAALDAAGGIVLGPGSLYTSVIASAVVPEIRDALDESRAPLVYVCNLGPQSHETEGYDVADHVAALHRHGIEPDVVLHDPGRIAGSAGVAGARAARLGSSGRAVHDPGLLAVALAEVLGVGSGDAVDL